MANYIVPFVLGVFVGQEIQDVPRVKPYLESAVKRVMQLGREIVANAQENTNETKETKETKETNSNTNSNNKASDGLFSRWGKKADDVVNNANNANGKKN